MKDIKKDFQSFTNETSTSAVAPSSAVLMKIHQQILAERPSSWLVATKLGGAHLVGSFLTLISCEQFGLQLFFHGGGLMHYFMEISPTFCHAFCGAHYFIITFLVARFLLKPEEWLRIKRSRTLTVATLALLSLGGFSVISHEVTLEGGLLWFIGASLGGEFMTWVKSPRYWFASTNS